MEVIDFGKKKKEMEKFDIYPVEKYSPNYMEDLESFLNFSISCFNDTLLDSIGSDTHLVNMVDSISEYIDRKVNIDKDGGKK